MRCPKCGKSFSSNKSRVTCFKCGTSWNTGTSVGINGPAVFIVGVLVSSILPTVGGAMLLWGGIQTYLEHKG